MTPEEMLASERQNVGAGWQPLIDEIDAKLTELDPGYVVDQIKEKWGGLRFYVTVSVDCDEDTERQIQDVLWAAEELSLWICEDCGTEDGTVTTQAREGRYWVRTLCGECR